MTIIGKDEKLNELDNVEKDRVIIIGEDKEPVKFITIGDDDYYRIVILENNDFKTSMFYNCFEKAESNLREIVEYATNDNKSKSNRFEDLANMNNTISFVGNRGTGKTSTMLSFAEALEDRQYVNDKITRSSYNTASIRFKVMDVIDPMMIGNNESILQIIIAKLFSEFKDTINKDGDQYYSQNREILECFNKLFSNLKILYSSDIMKSVDSYDSLEALNSLAVGVNMKHKIEELINMLLRKYTEVDGKSFLVIPIDDLDLTISKTEDMIEEIRKYLMIPNVVVLLSVNMNQLSDSIEQMFIREYKDLLQKKVRLHESTEQMTSRYLEKLFPLNRRIYMPNI